MRIPPRIVTIVSIALLLYSCARVRNALARKERVYQAPRMGAEYRFDEGLRKEKHPQNLFSKKERKDMEKMGTISRQERLAPNTRISPMQADSILTGKTGDTTRTDSTNTIPTDSTQSPQPDSTLPQRPDSTSPQRPDSTSPQPADTSRP